MTSTLIEPCDDCDTGIAYINCYDGVRRCRNCVHVLAREKGWYDPPEPPAMVPAPVPPPPPPQPLSRKAIKAEKELREAQEMLQLPIGKGSL